MLYILISLAILFISIVVYMIYRYNTHVGFEVDSKREMMFVWYQGRIIESEKIHFNSTELELRVAKEKIMQRATNKVQKIKFLRKRAKELKL